MNLRKAENYSIGLDLGTGSVGWAVVNEEGELFYIKGQPAWGSRLFSSAQTAASTRLKRGQRRRYERRRQRIDALQEFFLDEMASVDPDFFVRLRQSRLLKEDKDEVIQGYRWPLFNESDFTEADYYKQFPTIYHLRKFLMESEEKADLRLIYLALHNIVKYRGNFLYEDEGSSLKASNANAKHAAEELVDALSEYVLDVLDIDGCSTPDVSVVENVLDERGLRKAVRAESLAKAFAQSDKAANDICKQVARACFGYKVDYSKVFAGLEGIESPSFSLHDDEKAQEFLDEACPDEARRLFEAIQAAYSAFILSGMLKGASCISDAMIRSYEQHREDLAALKSLFRAYLSKDEYDEFFRGETIAGGAYDINKLVKGTYTSYINGEHGANKKGTTHEELIKSIKGICDSNSALRQDAIYQAIVDRIGAGDDSDFLLKQKTRSNGTIPYQLHLEEMDAIIKNQGKFYPFLVENREAIEKLVSSRIPYYVGPLNAGRDPLGKYPSNQVDPTRKFAWSVRRPGMENAKAYPWNVDEVIDTDRTADLFIQRMTGTCTYLYGQSVLPRHSLLYEEFCVLNELNGVRWCPKDGKPHRFDHVDKQRIFDELFKNRKSANVSAALLKKWLEEERGIVDAEVMGFQGETGLESKLGTYHDFCKLFDVENLDDAPLSFAELEEIVHWNTVFEDRGILKRKLNEKYGPEGDGRLSASQIKKLVARRYTGWGRLSKKLLTEIKVPASVPSGFVSIMDVLRDGNPFAHLDQMVFMEIINDKNLTFNEAIEQENKRYFANNNSSLTIEDMQGSPAKRRTVNQAMRILDEIIGIVGHNPSRICIEVTRDDDWEKKGSRTKTRYKQLKDALKAFKADASLFSELEEWQDNLSDDRLFLYFQQEGKCAYTREAIDINQLSSSMYQIDHIIPQAYIKDDSIDNRVLVKTRMNQRKLDSLLLDNEIIDSQYGWWKSLRDNGLISAKKFNRLTCRALSDRQIQGFINRQLVETSQIVKFVRQMCEQKYPGTEIVSVRANVSHGVRDNLGLVKCRELNNYHHAHDAFIACQVAEYVGRCYPKWQDGFSLALMRKYAKDYSKEGGLKKAPGKSGFIADGMSFRQHVDEQTGEIVWDNAKHNEYIRKALGFRTCFISRMVQPQGGAFWDETLFSPKDNAHHSESLSAIGHLPNGKPMLTERYGGTDNAKTAFSSIVEAVGHNGKTCYCFVGIPVVSVTGYRPNEIPDCVIDDELRKSGLYLKTVLRRAVPPLQKFILDGREYLLGGKTGSRYEILLSKEIIVDSSVAETIAKLFNDTDEIFTEEECVAAYDALGIAAKAISDKLYNNLKFEDRKGRFVSSGHSQKTEALKSLVLRLDGQKRAANLTMLGGPGQAGKLTENIQGRLKDITWVDQSVTGIFEKQTTFEDLCSGL